MAPARLRIWRGSLHAIAVKATAFAYGRSRSMDVALLKKGGLGAGPDLDPAGAGPFAGLVEESNDSGLLAFEELDCGAVVHFRGLRLASLSIYRFTSGHSVG